jgi:hypothetical protein
MKSHFERGAGRQGFNANQGRKSSGRSRAHARRASARRVSAISPVHYLRGETHLRTYRAQCAQCLQLYDRGRAEGLYGLAGRVEAWVQLEPDGGR